MPSFTFTKTEWGSGTCAPPASWGLFASAPAGGAQAQLKGAAGLGWPQWRSAAAVRGQERSPRGAAAPPGTGHRTPGHGYPTALLCTPLIAAFALPTLGPRASRAPDGPRGQGIPAPAAQGGAAAPGSAAPCGFLSRTLRYAHA